jgi:hypothetical protein
MYQEDDLSQYSVDVRKGQEKGKVSAYLTNGPPT